LRYADNMFLEMLFLTLSSCLLLFPSIFFDLFAGLD
jgi:hypothetical protein